MIYPFIECSQHCTHMSIISNCILSYTLLLLFPYTAVYDHKDAIDMCYDLKAEVFMCDI